MKSARAFFLALAFPAALAAQQPTAGPPTEPMMTVLRGRTMALQRNLAQAFDSIPASMFGYKPTAPQQTVGYIAQHLVNDNYFFCNNFGDMKATRPADETSTPDSVKATWPKEKLVESLNASFTFCEQALAQLNDAALAAMYTAGQAPNTRQVPRMSPVVGHIIDMADHYSQIANYMRLNNMLPPTALPRPTRQMRP
jgi:uncharacterized damage-inducible protein DinB